MKGCRRSYPHSRARNLGVGLIEVLVALLVISIGVLGMAGLQSRSLQHNQVAYVRSQAVIMANDMMDRIRANRSLAESTSSYVSSKSQHLADGCTEDYYPDTCETGSCSSAELAEYDLRQWKFQIACQLPEAEGSIAIENTSSGPLYRITLEFDESRGEQTPTAVILRSAL